ncbi:MAG TPA: sulfate ABC transporter ATP-binding protein [Acidimicrobiales bacterium]|nr:sulfate ABC transporter ATP-binding protein [Acidimicrobiales bacterium]
MGIRVTDVTKRFGDFVALDNVSIDIPTGSLTALLGPSGGGKSTLLRIIAGLERADSGTVEIAGEDSTSLPPQRRNVGFVFQHYAAFKHLNVFRNVAFGLEIRKRPKDEVRERVHELLQLVHLEQFADRLPSQLSGGQRQRMALARALAVEPEVMLLDEPFGALDAKVRKELRDWLRRLHDEVHVTTVFVTHDQEEAMEVADEIAVVNDGVIEQVGKPEDLYDRPANEFVMRFLGAVTNVGGHLVRPHDIEVLLEPGAGTVAAKIERLVRLGFEVRVEAVTAPTGEPVSVQLTRAQAETLHLERGSTIHLRAISPTDVTAGSSGQNLSA